MPGELSPEPPSASIAEGGFFMLVLIFLCFFFAMDEREWGHLWSYVFPETYVFPYKVMMGKD
ncbi:MAG: hypothetical protein ACOX0J_05610 [Thermoactinomyces vulgaris]